MKKLFGIVLTCLLFNNTSFSEEKFFKNIVNIKFCDDENRVNISKDCPNENEISNLEAVVISLEKRYNQLSKNNHIISSEKFKFLEIISALSFIPNFNKNFF